MKQFLRFSIVFLFTIQLSAQTQDLNHYSYVVVPDKFEFLNSTDQYQLNSMTLFYFDKSGFNAYLRSKLPTADRCEGLYADVEELRAIFGTKLQVVLRDCNDKEVYRSEEGKSKFKEFDKSYQDALRKAFKSIEFLRVQQKDVVMLTNSGVANNKGNTVQSKKGTDVKPQVSNVSGIILPTSKFSTYSHYGKSFLLRNTDEGFSLYEENTGSEEGLQLIGKIVVKENTVEFFDTSGQVSDATFDASGNLTIENATSSTMYKLMD